MTSGDGGGADRENDANKKQPEPRILDGLPLAPPIIREAKPPAPDPTTNPRTKPTEYAPEGVSSEPVQREAPSVQMIEPAPRRLPLLKIALGLAVLALVVFAVAMAVTRAIARG